MPTAVFNDEQLSIDDCAEETRWQLKRRGFSDEVIFDKMMEDLAYLNETTPAQKRRADIRRSVANLCVRFA